MAGLRLCFVALLALLMAVHTSSHVIHTRQLSVGHRQRILDRHIAKLQNHPKIGVIHQRHDRETGLPILHEGGRRFSTQSITDIITIDDSGNIVFSFCDLAAGFDDGQISVDLVSVFGLSVLAGTVELDACLRVNFDTCAQTVDLSFVANGPLTVGFEAFGSGSLSLDAFTVDIPDAGHAWDLPPLLTEWSATIADQSFCTVWDINNPVPDVTLCLSFTNFSIAVNGITICPTVDLYLGSSKVLTITYQTVADIVEFISGTDICPANSDDCDCLELTYEPNCNGVDSVTGNATSVEPAQVQSYRALDTDNNELVTQAEFDYGLARFGVHRDKGSAGNEYKSVDSDGSGTVSFDEFSSYSVASLSDGVYSEETVRYTPGDIAATFFGTMLFSVAITFVASWYLFTVKNWRPKLPSRGGGATTSSAAPTPTARGHAQA